MKKTIALLAALIMLFALGCGKKPDSEKGLPAEAPTAEPTVAPTAAPTAEPTAEPTEEPQSNEEPEDYDLWKAVEAELYHESDGREWVKITSAIPDGATLLIELPGQADYSYTNTKGELAHRKIHIPVAVFFPDTPLDTAEGEFAPHVTMTTADGKEYEILCPPLAYTFPTLSIEITSAFETDEDGSIRVKAGKKGVYRLSGTVSEPGAVVSVDGAEPVESADGAIEIELTAGDGAPATHVLTAEKMNCVTASVTIVVEP